MACDGVWDVMGNDEACFFLRRCIQGGDRDLGHMLEEMEVFCSNPGSETRLEFTFVFGDRQLENSVAHIFKCKKERIMSFREPNAA